MRLQASTAGSRSHQFALLYSLFVIVVCKRVFKSSIISSTNKRKVKIFEKYSNSQAFMQQSQMDAMNHSDFCVYTLFPVTKCLHMRKFR